MFQAFLDCSCSISSGTPLLRFLIFYHSLHFVGFHLTFLWLEPTVDDVDRISSASFVYGHVEQQSVRGRIVKVALSMLDENADAFSPFCKKTARRHSKRDCMKKKDIQLP